MKLAAGSYHRRVSRSKPLPVKTCKTRRGATGIYRVRRYIARMTRYLTLHPGDVIWFGCDGPTEPALPPGDLVEVETDAIGALRNRVIGEATG